MTDEPRRGDTEPYWASAVIATSSRRADDPRASDTRSTAEIIAAYIKSQRDDDATNSLATVHYRGGEIGPDLGPIIAGKNAASQSLL